MVQKPDCGLEIKNFSLIDMDSNLSNVKRAIQLDGKAIHVLTDDTTLTGVRVTLKITMDHTDIEKVRTDKLYVTIDFQGILSTATSDDVIKNVIPDLVIPDLVVPQMS